MKTLFFLLLLFHGVSFSQKMGSTTLEKKIIPKPSITDSSIWKFMSQFDETRSLSAGEMEWFYWTNYSRVNPKRFWDSVVSPILSIYPTFRNSFTKSLQEDLYSSHSLPFLKPNLKLKETALQLATELTLKKSMPSHTTPSGLTFQDRMASIQIKTCAGENISYGGGNAILLLTLLYIDEGVADHGHRKTLLDPLFIEMGVGISKMDDKFMVVQDFACVQN